MSEANTISVKSTPVVATTRKLKARWKVGYDYVVGMRVAGCCWTETGPFDDRDARSTLGRMLLILVETDKPSTGITWKIPDVLELVDLADALEGN